MGLSHPLPERSENAGVTKTSDGKNRFTNTSLETTKTCSTRADTYKTTLHNGHLIKIIRKIGGNRRDEFIIMPNHVHGIIIIDNIPVEKAHNNVGNADLRSLQCLEQQNNRSKMYLSKVIHGFKSSVTRTVRKRWSNKNFGWQKSFYEHIIRNDEDLFHTRRYIQDNPAQWALDKNNPQNWRE